MKDKTIFLQALMVRGSYTYVWIAHGLRLCMPDGKGHVIAGEEAHKLYAKLEACEGETQVASIVAAFEHMAK